MIQYATDCICGRHLLQEVNEGTCLYCGHGPARDIAEHAYQRLSAGNVGVISPTAELDSRVVALSRAPSHTWDEDACVRAAQAVEASTGAFPSAAAWSRAKGKGEHRPSYGTIINRFGSWPAFKQYCADVPRQVAA